MKIAVAVILYHPPENLIDNIKTYYEQAEHIYIFDNTENSKSATIFNHLEKISFFHDGKNEGISKRLNTACTAAQSAGYEWLLTMDQDTHFPGNTLAAFLDCAENFQGKENVALFGPEYERHHTKSIATCNCKESLYIITSGMLLNLNLFDKISKFDEALFIDGVDHDYCLKANLQHFSTIQFTHIFLRHTVGQEVYRSSFKTFYLFKKRKIVHSPLRCYYMYRNSLYLKKKYEVDFPEWVSNNQKIIRHHLKWSFYYNGNAIQTIRYLLKAQRDFQKGLMGKLEK